MGDVEVYNKVSNSCDGYSCSITPALPELTKKIKTVLMGEGDPDQQGYWLIYPLFEENSYGSPMVGYFVFEMYETKEDTGDTAGGEETPPEKVNLTSQEYIDIIRASYTIVNDITIISINEGLAKFTFNVYYTYTYHTHTAHFIPVIGEVGGGGVLEINAEPNSHDEGWLTLDQRAYLGLGVENEDGPFNDIIGAGEIVGQ